MIGVAIKPHQAVVAREFFELFKTPWELYQKGRRYDVLLSTDNDCEPDGARLTILCSPDQLGFDSQHKVPIRTPADNVRFTFQDRSLPVYGKAAAFPLSQYALVSDDGRRESAMFLHRNQDEYVVRLGYDLFEEVRLLLTLGQPIENAASPTLDLHIELLRELIIRCGIPLIEIPSAPHGYDFITCLTHDLDHPALRNHLFDHTMLGFLYRATAGSMAEVCKGRRPAADLVKNLETVAKLPFVYSGLAKDPWSGFDRYLEIERGLGATYFVIPRKGYAGRTRKGRAPEKRAAGYAAAEIQDQLRRIASCGGEIGLHGIDSWLNAESARQEQAEVTRSAGATNGGVRMHWLCFDETSPQVLDEAGFSYDSSVGYNEVIGYKAGTSQVYKPLGVKNLMELPLHIMDTALFFGEFMGLSNQAAMRVSKGLLDTATQLHGIVTLNWHDRSIFPERLWGNFYGDFLEELRSRAVWYPTASQAVDWFKKRRAVVFENVGGQAIPILEGPDRLKVNSPGLAVKAYKPSCWKNERGQRTAPASASSRAFDAEVAPLEDSVA